MSAKQVPAGCRWLFCLIGLAGIVVEAAAAETLPVSPPIDPFDYSYCGGKPVYPVIGFNFATACGPRNQIALGRRGSLMWLFPAADGKSVWHRGAQQLSAEELARLSLLAEVAQLAAAPPPATGEVIFNLGIDFQGRPYKRAHAALTPNYTPVNELFHAMLRLVPDAPLLPACAGALPDFDPTLPPAERGVPLAVASVDNPQAARLLAATPAATGLRGLRVEPPKPLDGGMLLDDQGHAARFPLKGEAWQLVFFGYTNCPDVCPMTLHKVALLLKALGSGAGRLQPVFISIDSGRDHPEDVRAFTGKFDARVAGLTGDTEALQTVAAEFGVLVRRYQGKTALAYTMEHSSFLYLLDPQGRIRLLYPAAASIEDIEHDLRQLWRPQEGVAYPAINVLYDAMKSRNSFAATASE